MSSKADTTIWTIEELSRFPSRVLKDEGDHSARLTVFETPRGPVVLKTWRPTGSRLYRAWARFFMGREMRFGARLDGTPGLPRFLGRLDAVSFLCEWVPGVPLARGLPQPRIDAALSGLEAALAALHARRFVHLDLHQKRNVLVGPAGECWLVDLGQGLLCAGPILRWIFPLLAAVDRRSVIKFRARYAPHTLPAAERERLVARHAERNGRTWKAFHRRVRELLVGRRATTGDVAQEERPPHR